MQSHSKRSAGSPDHVQPFLVTVTHIWHMLGAPTEDPQGLIQSQFKGHLMQIWLLFSWGPLD